MSKESTAHILIPKVDYKQTERAYKKFLKRHGYKTTVIGIAPDRKEKYE